MSIVRDIGVAWRGLKALGRGTLATRSELFFGSSAAPIWSGRSYRDFAANGYGLNAVVFACISAIISQFAQSPLRVYRKRGGEELLDHPLRQLLSHPNPFYSEYHYWAMTLLYDLLGGNSYTDIVRSGSGRPVELWPLRPDRVAVVPDPLTYIVGYDYSVDGRTLRYSPESIIHHRRPNPLNDYIGLSPMESMLREVATENEASEYSHAMLANMGVAPGVVFSSGSSFNEAEAESFYAKWRQRFSGQGRGGVLLVEGENNKVERLASSASDMALPALRGLDEARICAAFNVPPIIIGILVGLEHATYSNYETALVAMWQNCIQPLQNRFDDDINSRLTPLFGTDIEVAFDNSEVAAFASERNAQYGRATASLQAGWLTVNEARRLVNYPPVVGGDVFLRGLMTVAEPGVVSLRGGKVVAGAMVKSAGSKVARRRVGLARRNAIYGAYHPKMLAYFRQELAAEVDEARDLFSPQKSKMGLDDVDDLERLWTERIVGESVGLFISAWVDAAGMSVNEVGLIDFPLDNEQVLAAVRKYHFKFAAKVSAASADQVRQLIVASQTEAWSYEQITAALTEMGGRFAERAAVIAVNEVTRAAGGGAEAAWIQMGIPQKEWLAGDDELVCDYCGALDGTIVGMGSAFIAQNALFQPNPDGAPLDTSYDEISYGNAHVNCRCSIMPVLEGE